MADFNDIIFANNVLLLAPDDVAAFLDVTPPVATVLAPVGSSVISADTAVSFRVVDERKLQRTFIWVEYADTSSEVIYRDGSFLPAFRTLSLATILDDRTAEFVISRGIDVNGARVGGWPSSPRVYMGGIDSGGNVS